MIPRTYTKSDFLVLKRRTQINTLKVFNANVSEVSEDTVFRVDFNSGGNRLSLIVILGPEFPLENPLLKIEPIVQHPWVNEKGEVTGAPGLLNFTEHSDLGRVVQAIVRELELRPPSLLGGTISPPCSQRVEVAGSMSTNNFVYSSTPPGTHRFPPYLAPPNTPAQPKHLWGTFADLSNLNMSELEQLNSSADYLDEFVESLPPMKEINHKLEEWVTRNKQIATENLSKEKNLNELRSAVAERLETAQQLRAHHDTLSLEYQRLADRYSPQSIREAVKKAAIKSDEESENIADQFLNGEMDLDTFLARYTQKRMLSYCRKTKEEKLSHQLKELQRAGF